MGIRESSTCQPFLRIPNEVVTNITKIYPLKSPHLFIFGASSQPCDEVMKFGVIEGLPRQGLQHC